MSRQHYFSNTPWEPIVGYSRALRIGNHIHISGTTATDEDGNIVGINNPATQTRQVLENIAKALNHYGTNLTSIIRTRIYVTNIDHWKEIGKVHGKYFRDIYPVTSMIEVSRLIDPDILVEIEAEAFVS